MTDGSGLPELVPPHGGYRKLASYQMAEIVYDATLAFCNRFVEIRSRTHDQMVQAARSGKQNISDGCMVSGTSKKSELKLIGVARASLEELLQDYEDYLRQREMALWPKDSVAAKKIRGLCYAKDRSYQTYLPYVEDAPAETAANTLICMINQTNFLLDRQLRALEKEFMENGGFTERLYRARTEMRRNGRQS